MARPLLPSRCCFICHTELDGRGRDPWPLPEHENPANRCCDACEEAIVRPFGTRRLNAPTRNELERDLCRLSRHQMRIEYHMGVLRRGMARIDHQASCPHPSWEDGPDQGIDEHRERVCVACGYVR